MWCSPANIVSNARFYHSSEILRRHQAAGEKLVLHGERVEAGRRPPHEVSSLSGAELTYNLGHFMRAVAMPRTAEPWSLTSLREKLVKIGAKAVSHGRYVTRHRCSPISCL
jgi:hypothetical protein